MHDKKGSYHTHKLCSNEVDIGFRTVIVLAFLDTHTDQYKHFSSNHPLEYKGGVVKTLMHSLYTILSDERPLICMATQTG